MMFDVPKLPLGEGKCPPVYDEEKDEFIYPEPDPDYKDPEERETDKYSIEGKEEYYGYVTFCKVCGTSFQAYNLDGEPVRNYCPGCGQKL